MSGKTPEWMLALSQINDTTLTARPRTFYIGFNETTNPKGPTMKKTLVIAALNAAYFVGTGATLYSLKLMKDANDQMKKQTAALEDIGISLVEIAKKA